MKCSGSRFPSRGADRVCFVVAAEEAGQRILSFEHRLDPRAD
jgi:hypothetical protein